VTLHHGGEVMTVGAHKAIIAPTMSLLGVTGVKSLGYLHWKVDCKKVQWHEQRTGALFTGKAYFKFRYTLELILGPTSMEVFAIYRGKKVGMMEKQLGTEEQSNFEEHILEEESEASNVQYK
jgi:hypothetical protein